MGSVTEESSFSPDDSTSLYTKTWTPPLGTDTKARLVFVHGFSDHCNAYYNFFPALAARGIAVYGFDQRGWGRSASVKSQLGDSGPTTTVLADIKAFLNHVDSAKETSPLFLMGHSMGGAQVLILSLLQSQQQAFPLLSGVLLESPFIAFHPSSRPYKLTIAVAKIASMVLPKLQIVNKLAPAYVCRDPQVCQEWEADPLCHSTGTFEGLAGMLRRAADLTSVANGKTMGDLSTRPFFNSATLPIWIGHGTDDKITSCEMSQRLFDRLDVQDKTIKLYNGAYHKLHAEPDGVAEEFANDVAGWILERSISLKAGENVEELLKPRL
jgi:acylglycerol lipase